MTTKAIQKFVSELCTLPGTKVNEFEPEPGKSTMGQVVRDSLGRALATHCKTDEIAARVVSRLMEGQFRPTVAEIIATAKELTAAQLNLPEGCEICEGKPWITVEKLVWEFPKAEGERRGIQYMASGAERCQCAKGQWFRQKDRENKAKRDAGLPT